MQTGTDCLFCRIADGTINAKKVYEDDQTVAFRDINPQAPTHVLVIPRKHIASLNELTEGDAAMVGAVVHRAAAVARDLRVDGEGYRLVLNCGEAAGQTVPHLHVHLLGGRGFRWPPG
jgi:histidine triad (HIT) family protein